jgi:hypothetical protein
MGANGMSRKYREIASLDRAFARVAAEREVRVETCVGGAARDLPCAVCDKTISRVESRWIVDGRHQHIGCAL